MLALLVGLHSSTIEFGFGTGWPFVLRMQGKELSIDRKVSVKVSFVVHKLSKNL